MLDKLRNLKKVITNTASQVSFDPTRFDDPLATSIRWTPIESGGSNFRTHKFYTDGANQVGFKATLSAKLFSGIFILVGLGVAVGLTGSQLQSGFPILSMDVLFPLIFGLIFFGVGLYMFRSYAKPIIFDKMTGYHWKGWEKPDRYRGDQKIPGSVKLDDIHALQIVSEYIRGDKKNYYSYELNLVTHDGQRHNVIDHGDRSDLIIDANKLSDFLGKPVWDAS
ncbi:hypothetical protein [Rhodohalobacter sp. 8-1]|uniref:hypothetical protein n=1 Tax=Rhodohalobacter sp. 8-1 TaxID=3131972 RepID=UPI0030EB3C73